jgi:tight adherence protein C
MSAAPQQLMVDDGSGLAMLVAAAVAVATATGAAVALHVAARTSRGVWLARDAARRTPRLAAWLRPLLPFAAPLAAWLGPLLPLALREAVHSRLRRAELAEELTAHTWLALALCWALAAVAVAAQLPVALLVRVALAATLGALPWFWLRDAIRRREWEILRDLPAYADMLTLALEAGGALSVALRVATSRSPDGVLRRAFLRLQGDLRAGRPRVDALRALGERLEAPGVAPLVAALIQAEASGASLANVLRAQSDQRLDERFARAERLAMEAPVKMLAPLVLCIFPCTFVVLGFPIAVKLAAAWGGP